MYKRQNQDTATYWAANVFSKEAGTELLTSVNLSLWGSTSYEIYVTDGSLSLSGLTPAASGSADMLGYLSVTLDTPIELTGDQFAVIVKYSLRNGASIPVECNIGDYYRYVDAPSHSSFLSENGRSWAEISTADWDYSNLCIKAFTPVSYTHLHNFVPDRNLPPEAAGGKRKSPYFPSRSSWRFLRFPTRRRNWKT